MTESEVALLSPSVSPEVPGQPPPVSAEVHIRAGKVILCLSRPMQTLSLEPRLARRLAESLRQASHKAR